ncbi:putative beta-lysine N-acetyltransferase [Alkalihalobacillus trypoxylicola]|uniref:N-acetyltransferase domain-containing protein n=1 Tax=Alkalihalobacillus trypoxylicola TaxID=519424 RepID=A0A161PLJ5_9BACI|nr:putative beta-lysine N-acetyltransferase [Alkalihalobacillus trypoxylicola]KYG34803.1 hypothetical protein AZF04_00260 [Alkalihalobacillus trypoxylicola]
MPDTYKNKMIQTETLQAQLYLDCFNKRIRVDEFSGSVNDLFDALRSELSAFQYEKLIIYSRPNQWEELVEAGFQLEAIFSGFFNGIDNFAMCKYVLNERKNKGNWVSEDDLLEKVRSKPIKSLAEKKEVHQIKVVSDKEADQLASFYQGIFESYPVPIHDPDYILKSLKSGNSFYVIKKNDAILCAASADINQTYHHAEITDCATSVHFRNHGLMKQLIPYIENDLKKRNIYYLYSLARAGSFGMNQAFYQLHYDYKGRMGANCIMFGDYENLNVWVKNQKNN